MEHARHLELLAADSALLRDTAARDLDATVPPVPGWTVRAAVEHVAEVYEHKIACIAAAGARPQPWPPQWPAGRDPLEWYADARGRLLDTLTRTDPAAPSWTWWPADQTAGFWARRMAQETAVHRADVETAFGAPTPVADDLALDGIEEVLTMMLADDWSDLPQPDLTGTVRVTSGARAWHVVMERDEVTVTAGPGDAETTVSGDPSPLLLWLWGRAPDTQVDVSGDPHVVRRLRERLALATQ